MLDPRSPADTGEDVLGVSHLRHQPRVDERAEFERLDADQVQQLDETLARACSPEDVVEVDYESHYDTPEWWVDHRVL